MSQPKNRSAREKRRARQKAALAVRQEQAAAGHPLLALRPPFSGYTEWYTPLGETPTSSDMPADALELHTMLVQLAPLYEGKVPRAAIYLEQHIRCGILPLEAPGRPGMAAPVELPDMATVLADTADLCGDHEELHDDADTGALLHQLHFLGFLFLDDDRVIRLADVV